MELKLNTRRTFFIGFAFFAILMLWQVYMYYSPLYMQRLLENRFGEDGDYYWIIGLVMALDNIFAIFLVAYFGWWSDKTKSRMGRRVPFILIGGMLSLILFPYIALMYLLDSFVWYVIMVALLKLAMIIWRSPSVALMPDITPKPLRSKANAIINFVGYIGAIIGALLTMIFVFDLDNPGTQATSVIPFFITVFLMLGVLIMFVMKFDENKVVLEMTPQIEEGEKLAETRERVVEDQPLSKRDKYNLFIIMAAVFMTWFAFNALNTFGSLYGTQILGTTNWGLPVAVLAVASLITFIPSIWLVKKIGRKNSVMLGLGIIIASLVAANFVDTLALMVGIFAFSGIGWAIVNVNTYPMLVEMASRKNVGMITGVYYIASQSAMAITSVVAGFVFDWLGLEFFFIYAIIFMSFAFVLCILFKPRRVEKTVHAY